MTHLPTVLLQTEGLCAVVDADPDVDQVHVFHVDVGGPEDVQPGDGLCHRQTDSCVTQSWNSSSVSLALGRREHSPTYIRQDMCWPASVALNTLDFLCMPDIPDFGIPCFVLP